MISIPKAELIDVRRLKLDGDNPNRMTEQQLARLKTSIEKYGFIIPIITNKDLLVADGEQRLTVARTLKLDKVPVIRLPVEDVDRRLLRQVLNKLRGEHDLIQDAYEFERIIQAGHEDELKHLLDLSDSQLERYLTEIREPKDEDYEIPEIDKITTTIQRGDIYGLGKHRLMCGDATNEEDATLLMYSQKAHLCLTDPPYNIGYDYWDNPDKREDYPEWTSKWFEIAKANSDRLIITTGLQNLSMWCRLAEPLTVMVWYKRNATDGGKASNFQVWEPLICFGDFKKHKSNFDVYEQTLKPQEVYKYFKCPKPLPLFRDLIKS